MCDAHLACSKTQWDFTFMRNSSHGANTFGSGQFEHLLPPGTVWNYLVGLSLTAGLGAEGLGEMMMSEKTQVG